MTELRKNIGCFMERQRLAPW